MTYRLIQTAKPLLEPVTLSEAKTHLRLDTTADDILVTSLIVTARQICESFTGRGFIKQTFSMFIDEFPNSGIIELPRLPFLSLLAINIYDTADVSTAEDLTSYSIDNVMGRIALKDGYVVPIATRKINGIEISYDVGYGINASNVPEDIKQAILMIVTELYEHRGDNASMQNILQRAGVTSILQSYRIMGIK